MMDVAPFVPWLSFAAMLISVGTSITMFLTSGAKSNARILSDHDHRISKVENDLQHMPDRESVHRLQISLTKMEGQIGVMAKSSESMERTTRRVEDYLMSGKDRK